MEGLKIYRPQDIDKLISKRKGEKKFGEDLTFVDEIEDLDKHPARYVLLGIPEDIGVRANYGNPGTAGAWQCLLKSLVNIQQNRFNNPQNLILLGELECEKLLRKASDIDISDPNYHAKLGEMVKKIDLLLAGIVEVIISKAKIPVIIGGGHNNAFGNIKAAAKATGSPVNVLNIDAHTDLRQLEHRHSGNGFSYAVEGQFLCKYSVFGLHKNYTPEYIFEEMDQSENLKYYLAEDILKSPAEINRKFEECVREIESSKFGFELDCDAIANFPSSAMSPAGFTVNQVRNFISIVSKNTNCCYFHICEAAPDSNCAGTVGKALSYFICDFIAE